MGNARGNTYSRNHTILNPDKDSEFWNFTWHETGIYDTPSSIDYILQYTKKSSLYYLCHSQGCTTMYVMLSLKPEYNRKIKVYINIAPAGFMDHTNSSVIRIAALFEKMIKVSSK